MTMESYHTKKSMRNMHDQLEGIGFQNVAT